MVARQVAHRLPVGKLMLSVCPKGKRDEKAAVHVADIVVGVGKGSADPQEIRVVLPEKLGY